MTEPIQANPISLVHADAVRFGLPANTPELILRQAELQDLRWVAFHILSTHDRSAKKLAERFPEQALSPECTCALCRHSRPWLEGQNRTNDPSLPI